MRAFRRSFAGFGLAALMVSTALVLATPAFALTGDVKLPAPYLSRALDAVLIPITSDVRKAFGLKPSEAGVLILSVQPGGTADKQGFAAGDVIAQVKGYAVKKPIEVDEVVYYWIEQGSDDFEFLRYHGGEMEYATGLIPRADYEAPFDFASIAGWTSWTFATAFTYAEFYAEFSVEIEASFEEAKTGIPGAIAAADFIAAMTQDTDKDGIPDVIDPDDDGDGDPDLTDPDDDGDGKSDVDENSDTDGDGIADSEDPDDDGDGIPDAQDKDDDGDGIDDDQETDTDGDGIMDAEDPDDDNDGTPDTEDRDDDGDGIDDAAETDTDGDGIMDADDTDDDGDGIDDADDTDDDGDGVDDAEDDDDGGDDDDGDDDDGDDDDGGDDDGGDDGGDD